MVCLFIKKIIQLNIFSYLIDPDGQFHDYYGQNRRAREIAQVIKMKALQWDMKHGKAGKSWIDKLSSMISNDTKDVDQKTTNLENSQQNTTVAVA